MRKRLISNRAHEPSALRTDWLELTQAAQVEVTSEADGYPIEGALLPDQERGWRAATPGTQIIRLLFDEPQHIGTIRLVFKEKQHARTQEFLLRWLPQGTGSWRDVVRQQWNFSPPETLEEREEYSLNLTSAAALELSIIPDISQQGMLASLEELQLSVREEA
jgi:hypothetical protein